MGCSTSLAKLVLFIFNVAFFLFGVVSLGIGIWVVASRNELFKFLNLIDTHVSSSANKEDIEKVAQQHGLMEAAGFTLLFMGLFTLIVGFCGCFGALKESVCLLTVYAGLVTVVLVVQLAAGIMAAVFQSHIHTKTADALANLQNKFFVALPEFDENNSTASSAVTFLLNYMQVSLECCGAREPGDIADSSSWKASNREFENKTLEMPITCCRLKDKQAALDPRYNWKSFSASQLKDPRCPFERNNTERHQMTCYSGIMSYASTYARPLIGISLFVALLELVGILVACCLIRSLEHDKNYAK